MAISLETPDKIRSLQRKLYCKAKAEPAFRFYILYDKICREDILSHAYALSRANAGAPGVDGVTFEHIDASGVEGWLAGLREELVSKTYRPDPVRRATIPKPGGGERPLGIPTIRDRVVQTAAKIVLEPIFEADFEDNAYGYRPRRSAVDAVKETHRLMRRGYTDVVDADLSKYFELDPACGPPQIGGPAHRRPACAAADQAVAQSAGRETGRRRDAADERRQGQQARHASGRGREPLARQHLHEPLPEALASHPSRRSVPGSRRRVRRRLRHPQPRLRAGGSDVDEGGDDEARADAQRGENLGEGRPERALRFPWLQCAAETWKGVLHERLKSCLKAAQMMRAGPSGSAFRSGSQTTPSCCVQKAWW